MNATILSFPTERSAGCRRAEVARLVEKFLQQARLNKTRCLPPARADAK